MSIGPIEEHLPEGTYNGKRMELSYVRYDSYCVLCAQKGKRTLVCQKITSKDSPPIKGTNGPEMTDGFCTECVEEFKQNPTD